MLVRVSPRSVVGVGDIFSDVGGWITGAANTVGGWLKDAAATLQAVANVFGFVGTNFELTAVLQVLSGNFNAGDLWGALQHDWSNFWKDKDIAQQLPQALEDGDYTKAWNIATDNGKAYEQLKADFGIDQPQPLPQPDQAAAAASLVTQSTQGGVDLRAISQQLYDWGYYPQGDAVVLLWQQSAATTPVGATFTAIAAANTGDPVAMEHVVQMLTAAQADPVVQANWLAAAWGDPGILMGQLIAGLNQKAQAAVQAKALATAAAQGMSTGAKVAIGGVVVVGGSAAALAIYARYHRITIGEAWSRLWGSLRSPRRRA